jgi:hypothetical protein
MVRTRSSSYKDGNGGKRAPRGVGSVRVRHTDASRERPGGGGELEGETMFLGRGRRRVGYARSMNRTILKALPVYNGVVEVGKVPGPQS